MIPLATCCCGNKMYIETDGPTVGIVEDDKITVETSSVIVSDNGGRCYFDFVNKNVYATSDDLLKIYRCDDELTTKDTAFTMTGNYKIRLVVACHPWNQHLFYGARNDTADIKIVELRRVDYDGTNDQSLVSLGDTVATFPNIVRITTTKEEEFVFYSVQMTGYELRRCDADGSNDTLIFAAVGSDQIREVCVDNVNKLLYWGTRNGFGNAKIHRSDFDGAGETVILERDANIPPLPSTNAVTGAAQYALDPIKWSHRDERLYLWAAGTFLVADPSDRYNGLGIWSCLSDGSDLREEVVYPNVFYSSAPNDPDHNVVTVPIHMGDAYEEVGDDTLQS